MQSQQLQGLQEEGEISEQWHCRSANSFEKIEQVGEGTYAYVYKVRDKQTGEFFAMKKIKMESEKEGFPITALREIKILKNCKHPNILRLKEIVTTKAKEDSRNFRGSVYLVFEYMDHDLAGILAKDSKVDLSIPQIKCLTKQMLSAIQYLHANNIIHRDIKGANLLLNKKGELKLGDFGLARHYQPNANAQYTNKVITL